MAHIEDFNDFIGTAKPLDDIDIPRIGAKIGVGEDELHAFMDVEAAGDGFDSRGRPKMLYEKHVFYRNLPGSRRAAAVAEGLATSRWRPGRYPSDSYPILARAYAFHPEAALKAASWGLGQILGENHAMIGYDTAAHMVTAFMADEENHLEGIVDFLIASGIDDDLRNRNWTNVARVYNGPGYAQHNYHGRMAEAFTKWQGIKDTDWDGVIPVDTVFPTVRFGSKGFVVGHLQELLTARGYPVGAIDEDFGPSVRGAVLAFQADNNLTVDGVVGDKTWSSLEVEGNDKPISCARQSATVADLREKESRTVRTADTTGKGAIALGGVGTLGFLQEALDKGEVANGVLGRATELLEPMSALVTDNWPVLLAGGGVFFAWTAYRQKAIRVEDHRNGRNTGR
jgi:hypothetical protein